MKDKKTANGTPRRTIDRESTTMRVNKMQEVQELATIRQNLRAVTSALCARFGSRGKRLSLLSLLSLGFFLLQKVK